MRRGLEHFLAEWSRLENEAELPDVYAAEGRRRRDPSFGLEREPAHLGSAGRDVSRIP